MVISFGHYASYLRYTSMVSQVTAARYQQFYLRISSNGSRANLCG
jgi:hypothetical protein